MVVTENFKTNKFVDIENTLTMINLVNSGGILLLDINVHRLFRK